MSTRHFQGWEKNVDEDLENQELLTEPSMLHQFPWFGPKNHHGQKCVKDATNTPSTTSSTMKTSAEDGRKGKREGRVGGRKRLH